MSKREKQLIGTLLALLALLASGSIASAQLTGQYMISTGGGTATGGPFTVDATWGQPLIGVSVGGDWQAATGFWAQLSIPPALTVAEPFISIPSNYILETDAAHDTLTVNVSTIFQSTVSTAQQRSLRTVVSLTTAAGQPIAGATVETTVLYNIPANASVPVNGSFEIDPANWLPNTTDYRVAVTLQTSPNPLTAKFVTVHDKSTAPFRILDADGPLQFGSVATTLLGMAGTPTYNAGLAQWQLAVADGQIGGSGIHFSSAPGTVITVTNNGGALVVVAGTVTVNDGSTIDWNDWEIMLGETQLSKDGLFADTFKVRLPTCLGLLQSDGTLTDWFDAGAAPLQLDGNLNPVNGAGGVALTPFDLVCESYPVRFTASNWKFGAGTFIITKPKTEFTRKALFDQWLSIKGELPDSNDAFWYYLGSNAATDLVLHSGANPGMDVTLPFLSTPFFSHFPLSYIEHKGGSMRILRDEIVPADSNLGSYTAHTFYGRGCRDPLEPHALPDGQVVLQVSGDELSFTEEAGLHGDGVVAIAPVPDPGVQVTIRVEAGQDGNGQTVHESGPLLGQAARFYMPGGRTGSGDGPQAAINSGIVEDGQGFAYLSPYAAGVESDYAGANVNYFAGLDGRSRVGGDILGPYPMSTHFKAYLRRSGVTGIIGADETFLPKTLNVGKFDLLINDWEFSELSNEQLDSDIQGTVEVQYPSELSLAFDELYFNCCGNFSEMVLSDGAADQDLEYWNQSLIHIRSATFASADDCLTVDPALQLVVDATVNGLPGTQPGFLTVLDSGKLTNAKHPSYPASYVAPEPGNELAGGYRFTPTRHGFYNDYDGWVSQDNDGFINLVGEIKAPFFDPIKVHASTNGHDFSATPGIANQQVFINGGWADGYFDNTGFDATHTGWPGGFDEPFNYWTSTDEDYLPRVERKVWFARFGFPLKYDNVTCEFASVKPKDINLAIFSIGANVPRLTKETTEITFGTTINFNVSNLLEAAIEVGVEAATQAIFDAIKDGIGDMDDMLQTQICAFLDLELSARIEAQISGKLYDQLFLKLNDGEITDEEIDKMIEECIGQIPSLDLKGMIVELLDARLGKVDFAIGEIDKLLSLTNHLNGLAGGSLQNIGCIDFQAEINAAINADAGGFLGRLAVFRDRLLELRGFVANLRQELFNSGPFAQEIQSIIDQGMASLNLYANELKAAIKPFLQEVANELEQFGAFDEDGFKAQVTVKLQDQLCAQVFVGSIQALIRAKLRLALSYSLKQIVSSAFQQMGIFIAEVSAEAALDCGGIGTKIDSVAGYASSFIDAASVYGRAVVNHEELELLRLDNELTIHTEPFPLRFHGFFEWRSLQSDGSKGCDPALIPKEWKEILVGATVSPAYYSEDQLSATVKAQFSFGEPIGDDDREIIGFMGGIEIIGEGSYMSPLRMDRINAQFAVSGDGTGTYKNFEMYIAAEAQATINPSPISIAPMSNYKLHGGVFIGSICPGSEEVIHWASDATKDLVPFFGTVVFGEGSFPFYDVGCLLRVKAKAGLEAFAVLTNPSAADPSEDVLNWGATVTGEVAGDLLCLLSAKGSVALSSVGNSSGFRASGTVDLKAKAGKCPICKKFDKTLSGSFSTGGFDVGN